MWRGKPGNTRYQLIQRQKYDSWHPGAWLWHLAITCPMGWFTSNFFQLPESCINVNMVKTISSRLRADSWFAPSQWETALLCRLSLTGRKPRISPAGIAITMMNIKFCLNFMLGILIPTRMLSYLYRESHHKDNHLVFIMGIPIPGIWNDGFYIEIGPWTNQIKMLCCMGVSSVYWRIAQITKNDFNGLAEDCIQGSGFTPCCC